MAYDSRDKPIVVSSEETAGGERLDYCWFAGARGPFEGVVVIRTDRFGQQWRLELPRGARVTGRVAAGLLRVTAMTVSNWIRAGVFPNITKRNGVTMIPLRDVERVARSRGIPVPFRD